MALCAADSSRVWSSCWPLGVSSSMWLVGGSGHAHVALLMSHLRSARHKGAQIRGRFPSCTFRGHVKSAACAGSAAGVPPPCYATLSHEVGGLGLLERENAACLNAALRPLAAALIPAFTAALAAAGVRGALFLTSNDGTLLPAEAAQKVGRTPCHWVLLRHGRAETPATPTHLHLDAQCPQADTEHLMLRGLCLSWYQHGRQVTRSNRCKQGHANLLGVCACSYPLPRCRAGL